MYSFYLSNINNLTRSPPPSSKSYKSPPLLGDVKIDFHSVLLNSTQVVCAAATVTRGICLGAVLTSVSIPPCAPTAGTH